MATSESLNFDDAGEVTRSLTPQNLDQEGRNRECKDKVLVLSGIKRSINDNMVVVMQDTVFL